MDDNEQALRELEALVQIPGALRTVTNEIRQELRANPLDPRSKLAGDLDGAVLRNPTAFVIHDVTSIEPAVDEDERPKVPGAKLGTYLARTAEGDWRLGYPIDLLTALRKART